MKKLLFILIFTSLLYSCSERRVKTNKEIETQLTSKKKVDLFDEINKFTYEGHDYIYFQKGYGKHKSSGIVHNPTCSCSN